MCSRPIRKYSTHLLLLLTSWHFEHTVQLQNRHHERQNIEKEKAETNLQLHSHLSPFQSPLFARRLRQVVPGVHILPSPQILDLRHADEKSEKFKERDREMERTRETDKIRPNFHPNQTRQFHHVYRTQFESLWQPKHTHSVYNP